MRETCLTCGERLVPYGHWGLCPVHNADLIEKVKPPTVAEIVRSQVGGLLQDKGRPTVNGVKK